MGIPGLLQGLKCVAKDDGNIRSFEGQSVTVDASSWLHKSVYAIADHYVETIERGHGRPDHRSIQTSASYMKQRCQELLTSAKIQCIYLVLDGKRCPLKIVTNDERDRKRQEHLQQARTYKRRGDKANAYEKYKACIKVTLELTVAVAKIVAEHFRTNNRVQIVWSPYEADAMLVKLCVDGLASAIVTEDSDVLLYCATCRTMTPILFKLDRRNGNCTILSMRWLLDPIESIANKNIAPIHNTTTNSSKKTEFEDVLKAFALRETREPGFGVRLFVQACVLSGCDYAPNQLDGVGYITAFKTIRSAIHRDDADRFRHALTQLPAKACKPIHKIEYEELLAKSEAVFYYHPVIQSSDGRIVYLQNPAFVSDTNRVPSLERFGGDVDFLGHVTADETADRIVAGNVGKSQPPSGVAPPTKRTASFAATKPLNSFSMPLTDIIKQSKEFVPLLNPYKGLTKRKRDALLLPNSDAIVQQPALKPNPFAKFTLGSKGKENQASNTSNFFLNNTQDVRFVAPLATRKGVSANEMEAVPAAETAVSSD
jgi:exonuclease-1